MSTAVISPPATVNTNSVTPEELLAMPDSSRYELVDGQLVERFLTRGGEAAELAFAALVERHGPMVLRVCRSLLRDPNDATAAAEHAVRRAHPRDSPAKETP